MSDSTTTPKSKPLLEGIWKRLMLRYSILSLIGLIALVLLFPQMQHESPIWMMVLLLLSGVAFFGGLFGIAVALFFHLWHSKKT